MQILRIEKKDEATGELLVEMLLTKEQTQVLIEYALASLVSMGLVQFVNNSDRAKAVEAPQEEETFAVPANQSVN